jgi:threonylcarbamoyladenosine tRNA methylthiotransferase MtaB
MTEKSKTVFIQTHGCKLNQSDSSQMARQFASAGYQIIDSIPDADIYILNTCTVTATADAKARQALRSAHKTNPEALIVATGCYSQRAQEELSNMNEVSLVIKNTEKDNLVRIIDNQYITNQHTIKTLTSNKLGSSERCRGMIKIQEGCNQVCSYCIVPTVRGRERSIKVSDLIAQINQFVSEGYQEIVLTGTQLGSYGFDLKGASLPTLISSILSHTDIARLRISSLQPQEINSALLSLWQNSKLCPHFHLPLQSGSDKILKLMRRRYTSGEFLATADLIRNSVKNVAITGDLIVGYPYETELDFTSTTELVSKIQFSNLHVFPYSKRPGTTAYYSKEQIPQAVKKERLRKLSEIVERDFADYRNKFLGDYRNVLWDTKKTSDDVPMWKGITDNYIRVSTRSQLNLRNTITRTKLLSLENDCVISEIE